MTALGLFGAGGRMGHAVVTALGDFPDLELMARVGHRTAESVRFDACDVVIDFALASATEALMTRLEGTRTALVTGVTARTEAQEALIEARSRVAPVLRASNFSLGVAALHHLVAQAVTLVGADWDIEITEMHHRRKKDAPSGTALALGRTAAEARGLPWPTAATSGRAAGGPPRSAAEIGLSAARGGDVVGEHTVYLLTDGERIELTHRATDRGAFARGALKAAAWLAHQPAGLYTLDHLFGKGG